MLQTIVIITALIGEPLVPTTDKNGSKTHVQLFPNSGAAYEPSTTQAEGARNWHIIYQLHLQEGPATLQWPEQTTTNQTGFPLYITHCVSCHLATLKTCDFFWPKLDVLRPLVCHWLNCYLVTWPHVQFLHLLRCSVGVYCHISRVLIQRLLPIKGQCPWNCGTDMRWPGLWRIFTLSYQLWTWEIIYFNKMSLMY